MNIVHINYTTTLFYKRVKFKISNSRGILIDSNIDADIAIFGVVFPHSMYICVRYVPTM